MIFTNGIFTSSSEILKALRNQIGKVHHFQMDSLSEVTIIFYKLLKPERFNLDTRKG